MGFLDKFFGGASEKSEFKASAKGVGQNSVRALNLAQGVNSAGRNLAQNGENAKATQSLKTNGLQTPEMQAQKLRSRRTPRKTADLNIATPCQSELEKWLGLWSEQSKSQESALNKLFHRTYPRNDDMDEILVKVAALNDFYSTNIYNIFAVAQHIKGIARLDERLQKGDESLVSDIANVSINGKARFFYSFASKFCSHHNDKDFAIYDSFVDKMLTHFQKRDKFGTFTRDDLKDYGKFKKALNDFRAFYGLQCDLKQLDGYLWRAGKTHFARYEKAT